MSRDEVREIPVALDQPSVQLLPGLLLRADAAHCLFQPARYIAVDGDIICDFSDYSRLHSIVYQEIIAGRGYQIADAAGAVKLAERVRQMAETELPAAH
ncbi:MAG: hypothetical protein ABSA93_19505 [Streptosporangiaceae bacterium]